MSTVEEKERERTRKEKARRYKARGRHIPTMYHVPKPQKKPRYKPTTADWLEEADNDLEEDED